MISASEIKMLHDLGIIQVTRLDDPTNNEVAEAMIDHMKVAALTEADIRAILARYEVSEAKSNANRT